MYGTFAVNAWADIHEGCQVTYRVRGSNDAYLTVSDRKQQPFEIYFKGDALRQFVEQGGRALAEMDELAAREEAAPS